MASIDRTRATEDKDAESGGPYLSIAAVCDRVLIEENGIASLIRVVDRFKFNAPRDTPPDAAMSIESNMFFRFNWGAFRGSMILRVDQVAPDGSRIEGPDQTLEYQEGSSGVQLRIAFSFVAPMPGLYWMEAFLDGALITRLPIQVELVRDATEDAIESSSSQ